MLVSKQGKLQVKELCVGDNKLTDKTVKYLLERSSDALQSLMHLDVSDNNIGAEGIKSITTALTKSSQYGVRVCPLLNLDLSGKPFQLSVLNTLENVLHSRTLFCLQSLFLDGSLPGDADTNASWLTTFGKALSAHYPYFTTLGLSNNNLGVPGATALARNISRLQKNLAPWCDGSVYLPKYSYTTLYLDKTNLGDKGLCAFIKNLDGLDGVCYFNKLHLDDNGIQATGVSCLADAVCSRKIVLEGEVCLNDNLLGLEGCFAVGRMLSSCHCKLRKIYLCGCKLTTESDLPPNSISSNLGNNGCVSSKTVRDIKKQICEMSQSSTITLLVLDNNSFNGTGIHILVAFMYLCPNLKIFFTSNCEITSDDLIELFDTLSSQKSSFLHLKRWKLGKNKIDNRGVSALIDHLHVSSLFTKLGYGRFGGIILNNNPDVTNEMKKRLKRELRERSEVRRYY